MSSPLSDTPLGGRLHPAAIGVWSIASLGPGALLLFAGGPTIVLPVVFVGLSAVAGMVKYLRFSWRIEAGTLTIEQGLLQRSRRVIPVERIQSVEVVRGLRHRLFGVVELRVETVGSSSAEGKLDALDPATAERVRRTLLRQPVEATQEAPRDDVAHVTPARIVMAGLTGGRVGVAAGLFAFGFEVLGDRMERVFSLNPTDDLRRTALVIAAVLVGAFVISIVATVLTYWDFTVSREGDAYRIQRGLLENRTDTIPIARIQALWLEENIIRRRFGLAAVRVEVAGRSGGEAARLSAVLLPIATRTEALALIARVHDERSLAGVTLTPMPKTALRRRLTRAAVVATALTAGATAGFGSWGLLASAAFVPLAALGFAAYRSLGWALTANTMVSRSGVLVRRTAWTKVHRLQSVGLRQTPLQRWAGLATLRLHIARNRGLPGDPQLVDVEAAVAQEQLRELSAAAITRTPGPIPAAP